MLSTVRRRFVLHQVTGHQFRESDEFHVLIHAIGFQTIFPGVPAVRAGRDDRLHDNPAAAPQEKQGIYWFQTAFVPAWDFTIGCASAMLVCNNMQLSMVDFLAVTTPAPA
jgi:hypothetical protein